MGFVLGFIFGVLFVPLSIALAIYLYFTTAESHSEQLALAKKQQDKRHHSGEDDLELEDPTLSFQSLVGYDAKTGVAALNGVGYVPDHLNPIYQFSGWVSIKRIPEVDHRVIEPSLKKEARKESKKHGNGSISGSGNGNGGVTSGSIHGTDSQRTLGSYDYRNTYLDTQNPHLALPPQLQSRFKDSKYVQIKGPTMFIYENEQTTECLGVITIPNYSISVPGHQKESHIYSKRNPILMRFSFHDRLYDRASSVPGSTTASAKSGSSGSSPHGSGVLHGHHGLPHHTAIHRTHEASTSDLLTAATKDYYLSMVSAVDKEDLLFTLLRCSRLKDTNAFVREIPKRDSTLFDKSAMSTLIRTIHSTEHQFQAAWLNAMIGRMFLGVYKTPQIKEMVLGKLVDKLARVRLPNFLNDMHMRAVHLGDGVPYITRPKLVYLKPNGDMTMDATLTYAGGFRAEVEAEAVVTVTKKIQPIKVSLVLMITLVKLEGRVQFWIKPPPCNRIWYGFYTKPHVEMKIEPVVSDKHIKSNLILKAIENKLLEAIAETMVLPNMDDIPFADTDGIGGIFGEDILPKGGPTPVGPHPHHLPEVVNKAQRNSASAASPAMPPTARSTTPTYPASSTSGTQHDPNISPFSGHRAATIDIMASSKPQRRSDAGIVSSFYDNPLATHSHRSLDTEAIKKNREAAALAAAAVLTTPSKLAVPGKQNTDTASVSSEATTLTTDSAAAPQVRKRRLQVPGGCGITIEDDIPVMSSPFKGNTEQVAAAPPPVSTPVPIHQQDIEQAGIRNRSINHQRAGSWAQSGDLTSAGVISGLSTASFDLNAPKSADARLLGGSMGNLSNMNKLRPMSPAPGTSPGIRLPEYEPNTLEGKKKEKEIKRQLKEQREREKERDRERKQQWNQLNQSHNHFMHYNLGDSDAISMASRDSGEMGFPLGSTMTNGSAQTSTLSSASQSTKTEKFSIKGVINGLRRRHQEHKEQKLANSSLNNGSQVLSNANFGASSDYLGGNGMGSSIGPGGERLSHDLDRLEEDYDTGSQHQGDDAESQSSRQHHHHHLHIFHSHRNRQSDERQQQPDQEPQQQQVIEPQKQRPRSASLLHAPNTLQTNFTISNPGPRSGSTPELKNLLNDQALSSSSASVLETVPPTSHLSNHLTYGLDDHDELSPQDGARGSPALTQVTTNDSLKSQKSRLGFSPKLGPVLSMFRKRSKGRRAREGSMGGNEDEDEDEDESDDDVVTMDEDAFNELLQAASSSSAPASQGVENKTKRDSDTASTSDNRSSSSYIKTDATLPSPSGSQLDLDSDRMVPPSPTSARNIPAPGPAPSPKESLTKKISAFIKGATSSSLVSGTENGSRSSPSPSTAPPSPSASVTSFSSSRTRSQSHNNNNGSTSSLALSLGRSLVGGSASNVSSSVKSATSTISPITDPALPQIVLQEPPSFYPRRQDSATAVPAANMRQYIPEQQAMRLPLQTSAKTKFAIESSLASHGVVPSLPSSSISPFHHSKAMNRPRSHSLHTTTNPAASLVQAPLPPKMTRSPSNGSNTAPPLSPSSPAHAAVGIGLVPGYGFGAPAGQSFCSTNSTGSKATAHRVARYDSRSSLVGSGMSAHGVASATNNGGTGLFSNTQPISSVMTPIGAKARRKSVGSHQRPNYQPFYSSPFASASSSTLPNFAFSDSSNSSNKTSTSSMSSTSGNSQSNSSLTAPEPSTLGSAIQLPEKEKTIGIVGMMGLIAAGSVQNRSAMSSSSKLSGSTPSLNGMAEDSEGEQVTTITEEIAEPEASISSIQSNSARSSSSAPTSNSAGKSLSVSTTTSATSSLTTSSSTSSAGNDSHDIFSKHYNKPNEFSQSSGDISPHPLDPDVPSSIQFPNHRHSNKHYGSEASLNSQHQRDPHQQLQDQTQPITQQETPLPTPPIFQQQQQVSLIGEYPMEPIAKPSPPQGENPVASTVACMENAISALEDVLKPVAAEATAAANCLQNAISALDEALMPGAVADCRAALHGTSSPPPALVLGLGHQKLRDSTEVGNSPPSKNTDFVGGAGREEVSMASSDFPGIAKSCSSSSAPACTMTMCEYEAMRRQKQLQQSVESPIITPPLEHPTPVIEQRGHQPRDLHLNSLPPMLPVSASPELLAQEAAKVSLECCEDAPLPHKPIYVDQPMGLVRTPEELEPETRSLMVGVEQVQKDVHCEAELPHEPAFVSVQKPSWENVAPQQQQRENDQMYQDQTFYQSQQLGKELHQQPQMQSTSDGSSSSSQHHQHQSGHSHHKLLDRILRKNRK